MKQHPITGQTELYVAEDVDRLRDAAHRAGAARYFQAPRKAKRQMARAHIQREHRLATYRGWFLAWTKEDKPTNWPAMERSIIAQFGSVDAFVVEYAPRFAGDIR